MKPLKKIFQALLLVALLFGLYVGGVILYGTFTEYAPVGTESLEVKNKVVAEPLDSVFSFMIWNIGYSGLGAKEDFFYDGGKMVRPSKERVLENLEGIKKTISANADKDFILLQEVDENSRRSYNINEVEEIAGILPHHAYSFATNYVVKFVPVPLHTPWNTLGKVRSGLASYTKYPPVEAERVQFPGSFSYPKRVFMLDRCFLVQRFNLPGGKNLVVINTHNSAYDDGSLKQQEMDFLRNWLLQEYAKGSYIIAGGDWNQIPPGFDLMKFAKEEKEEQAAIEIPQNYLPQGWQWVYDDRVATNRKNQKPFDKDKTFTSLIDFYLVSPNVTTVHVEGISLDFAYSDHQPVLLTVRLE